MASETGVKLSEKEITTTLNDADYMIIIQDGAVRRVLVSKIKEYLDNEILGGAS